MSDAQDFSMVIVIVVAQTSLKPKELTKQYHCIICNYFTTQSVEHNSTTQSIHTTAESFL